MLNFTWSSRFIPFPSLNHLIFWIFVKILKKIYIFLFTFCKVSQAPPLLLCHQSANILNKKYVDDLNLLESLNLKLQLVKAMPVIGPPNFHDQPGLCFPPEQSVLQHQLSDLLAFTNTNTMKNNMKTAKVMPFKLSKKYDSALLPW